MLLNNYANTINQNQNSTDDFNSDTNDGNLHRNTRGCNPRLQNNSNILNNDLNQNNSFFGNPSFSTILFFILILLILFFFNNNN